MKIFPAVDILSGRCVQLVQGRRETATSFGRPLECALRWINAGARQLHVINLDGAFGNSAANLPLIREIIRNTGVTIQLGVAFAHLRTRLGGWMQELTVLSSGPWR